MKNLQNLLSTTSLGNISSGSGIQYLLYDQFITDVAAGSVNNTSAEPTGGVRTVTDTNSKISISSGKLQIATGVAANDIATSYTGFTRTAGRIIISEIQWENSVDQLAFELTGAVSDRFRINSAGAANALVIVANGGASNNVGTVAISTLYKFAMILRSTGTFFLIKGGTFTNWTLLWIDSVRASNPSARILLTSITGSATVDNFRAPVNTYLLPPLAYDTFTRSNGAIGSTENSGPDSQSLTPLVWSGGTWTIASNVAVNTPATLGSEILTDGGLEAWTSATNLTSWTESLAGTSTVNQETSVVHGGSNALRIDVDASASISSISQVPTAVAGLWYKLTAWAKASSGGVNFRMDFPGGGSQGYTTTTSYQQFGAIFRALTVSPSIIIRTVSGAASVSVYADDISVKPLTTSELFASITTSTKDVIADVNLTLPVTLTAPAGLVLNLDSTSNPQNFVIAYVDMAGARTANLVKCVAGTHTSVISASITYSAGATLRVIKDGTSYQLFYNNAKIGSTSTISDAGVVNNTLHGLFSTDSGNTLDNFLLFPRGVDNNYSALDAF